MRTVELLGRTRERIDEANTALEATRQKALSKSSIGPPALKE